MRNMDDLSSLPGHTAAAVGEQLRQAYHYMRHYDRLQVIRKGIEPGATRAIEIGPLDRPVLTKPKFDVRYLDFADTQTLREKYSSDPGVGHVAEVDIVWDGAQRLSSVVGGEETFDAVVASHVIEHVPDPIGWLAQFADVLVNDGIVNLAIPDKRVTFDVNRRLTEASDWIDGFLRKLTQPSYTQVFDFHTKTVMSADTALLWAGAVDYSGLPEALHHAREALDVCREMTNESPHVDVHCGVYTPASFVDILEVISGLDLIDFSLAELVSTRPNTIEFYARLKRLDRDLSLDDRRREQAAAITAAREALAMAPVPLDYVDPAAPDAAQAPPRFVPGDRERRAIEFKRRAVVRARNVFSRDHR